jgi:ADP-ribosylglycohydrolase
METAFKTSRPNAAEKIFDHALGAILGAAVADAMGWITEFQSSREALKKGDDQVTDFVTWSKPTGGRFHTYIDYISRGEYSDDTQLTLCTARCLNPDGTFNADKFADELRAWLDYARGAGAAIKSAARNLREHRSATWHANFYRKAGRYSTGGYIGAGGNGAAMRVLPIALANRLDAQRTSEAVWQNSITTHGHPRAIVGALVIAEAARVLAESASLTSRDFVVHLQTWIPNINLPDSEEFRVWKKTWDRVGGAAFGEGLESTKKEMQQLLALVSDVAEPLDKVLRKAGCFDPTTRGSGTGSVAASIGAFLRYFHDYEAGVKTIVNTFGIDTDTIGSMYGGLVGARRGSLAIPEKWSSGIQDYQYLVSVADALSRISVREPLDENPLAVDMDLVRGREDRDVLVLSRNRSVSKGQRVVHHLLGPGWVHAVNEQVTRSGMQMLLAEVVLDSGQSVKFRSSRPGKRSKVENPKQPRRPRGGAQGALL